MAASTFKDFDQAWQQRTKKPLKARVFGETVTFPASVPLKLMLRMGRIKADLRQRGLDESADVPDDYVVDLVVAAVGEEQVQKWADKGMGMDQFGDIFTTCWQHWSSNADPSEA